MSISLILASSSATRRRLLTNAGVDFRVVPPGLDEKTIKTEYQAQGANPSETAMALALAKARTVSSKFPDQLVLGADQILVCNGQWFEKPKGTDGIRNHLTRLSGQQHKLINGVAIVECGIPVWCYDNTITMKMRRLNEDFVNYYIDRAGEEVHKSVGAYNLEGLGIQLVSQTDGDFFSILGLPLIPILEFLRKRGIVPS